MNADQLLHTLKNASAQGGEPRPLIYGHIASYDPLLHRVRCIIPSMTDQDGVAQLSPWMPMGTASAGAGYGVQVIYQGGATIDNPTAGEQVLIAVFDRQRGVSAVPCMFYHASNLPPATDLPEQSDGFGSSAPPAAPGDVIIAAPPAQTGGAKSVLRLRLNGDIEIWCAGRLNADVIGDINATTETGNLAVTVVKGNAAVTVEQGDVTVTATAGNATVQAAQSVNILAPVIRLGAALTDQLLTLCTSTFQAFYNRHTHPNQGFPNPQADASTVTSIVRAE